jgi:phospholipase C
MEMRCGIVLRARVWLLTVAIIVLNAFPRGRAESAAPDFDTRTPIKHLVVIFDENRPFDHYFGTYPEALNLPGEVPF